MHDACAQVRVGRAIACVPCSVLFFLLKKTIACLVASFLLLRTGTRPPIILHATLMRIPRRAPPYIIEKEKRSAARRSIPNPSPIIIPIYALPALHCSNRSLHSKLKSQQITRLTSLSGLDDHQAGERIYNCTIFFFISFLHCKVIKKTQVSALTLVLISIINKELAYYSIYM